MAGFAIVRDSQIESAGNWRLVRRALGLEAFGINMVDIAPGESIPEHDETARDQEEVFLALDGDATIVIDGAEHHLPVGAFARLDPERTRTVVNKGDTTVRVMIISAPRTSGYEPMDWA